MLQSPVAESRTKIKARAQFVYNLLCLRIYYVTTRESDRHRSYNLPKPGLMNLHFWSSHMQTFEHASTTHRMKDGGTEYFLTHNKTPHKFYCCNYLAVSRCKTYEYKISP